jgi:cell surface protein SprA
MSFSWQFFEGGLLNLGTDYQLDISSSLVHLETDSSKHQRPFSAILDDIFLSDHLIYFGIDQSYNQSINLSTKPVVPQILMLDKIIGNPTLRYSVRYSWTNNVAAGPLGRNAGWGSDFSYSFDFNLKPISEKIWSPTTTTTPAPASTDTVAGKKSTNVGKTLDQLTRVLFKTTIFDFDKFNFNFNQRNNVQNSGVLGGPGFTNLFNRVPFFQSSLVKNGPSLLYQLGISSDPHGDVVLKTKGTFPFITGYTVPGLRATGMLVNMFSQNNQISMQTSRPLLEGVQLQLNWKVGWSYNENQTIVTDSLGNIRSNSGNRSVSGDVERSFITLPPVLVFKFFKTSIEDVNKKYETLKLNQGDSRTDEAKLSQAFEEGFEALPWLTKILGKFAPRANWSIRWSGLEKYSLFNSFASSVSIGHSYSSNFKRRWKLTPVKDQISGENIMSEVTESQSITFGFTPLIEFNIGFKQLMKGNLNAAFRYGTSTSYDLSPSLQNVTEGSNSDYSITASYSRQGFEIPFFGLSLSNDIDINFNYTYSRNTRRLYDFKDFREEGTPMEGSKRTTMEPRLRYTLSARVNASLYYRYTKLSPDEGGSKIPGSTINEGGLDIRVAIQ